MTQFLRVNAVARRTLDREGAGSLTTDARGRQDALPMAIAGVYHGDRRLAARSPVSAVEESQLGVEIGLGGVMKSEMVLREIGKYSYIKGDSKTARELEPV